MRLIIFLFMLVLNLYAKNKIALVIGNQNYTNQTGLKNPISDATLITSTLEGIGFEVMFAYNKNLDGLDKKLNRFISKARKSKIAVVYYAGHGIGINGINYLIPLNVKGLRVDNLDRKLMRVDELKGAVDEASDFGVVLFDACRNSFFSGQIDGLESGRGSRALGQPTVKKSQNILVSFSTQAGKIAKDEVNNGKHSPYAIALSKKLILNKDIRLVMGGVKDIVENLTNYEQQPVYESSFGEKKHCLTGKCNSPTSRPITPTLIKRAKIIQIGDIMYQNQPFNKKYSLKKAIKYCQDLTLGRYTNWRLPTKEELYKISNIRMYNGELKYWNIWFNKNKNKRIRGLLNSYFIRPEFIYNFRQKDSHFWTWRKGSPFAWIVNFEYGSYGKEYLSHKTNRHLVLCVR